MKLDVDFSELLRVIEKMGARQIPIIDIGSIQITTDIDLVLGTTGQAISLEDLEYSDGLLSYRGRQVLLYIPDHGTRIEKVIEDNSLGNKYHVSDCTTLETMRNKKRFDRYIVTNKLSGDFDISGIIYHTSEEVTQSVKLNICKNCLNNINYMNYRNTHYRDKKNIFNDFRLESFFENYSTLFRYFPKFTDILYSSKYTSDWNEISTNLKSKKNYICESCKTSFSDHKQLLHTHHRNGVKSDNSTSNLKVVCIDCHRKEPNHTHLMMKNDDLQKIYRLRHIQQKTRFLTWDDVFKFADLSLHGYLHLCKHEDPQNIPKVGYVVDDDTIFDLVFDKYSPKKAIVINISETYKKMNGWQIMTLGEGLKLFSKNLYS